METEKNRAVARRYIDEFWSKGKLELADELVNPAFTRIDPSTPWVSGDRDGVMQLMLALRSAFPDLHFEIQELVTSEDKVVVRWTTTGTHQGQLLGIAPTGKSTTVMGISFYRLVGNQLVDECTVWDTMGMMQQLGVIPTLA